MNSDVVHFDPDIVSFLSSIDSRSISIVNQNHVGILLSNSLKEWNSTVQLVLICVEVRTLHTHLLSFWSRVGEYDSSCTFGGVPHIASENCLRVVSAFMSVNHIGWVESASYDVVRDWVCANISNCFTTGDESTRNINEHVKSDKPSVSYSN